MTTPIFTSGPQKTSFKLAQEYTAPLSDVLGATASEAWTYSPLSSIGRSEELSAAQGERVLSADAQAELDGLGDGAGARYKRRSILNNQNNYELVEGTGKVIEEREKWTSEGYVPEVSQTARILTQEQAKERIAAAGAVGLSVPPEGVTDLALDILIDRKKKEMEIRAVHARGAGGFAEGAAKLGVGIGVTILDPLNVASMFIPVVGPARLSNALAQQTSRVARAGIRARAGVVEGTVGAAVVEPIILGAATQEQADYGILDSMLNVAFGAVAGGGLHAGIGGIADASGKFRVRDAITRAYQQAGHAQREAELRVSVSQMAEDRIVEIDILNEFTPIRQVERKVHVPGQDIETVGPAVERAARDINPDVMDRFDVLEQQKAEVRQQIADADPARQAEIEAALEPIDTEIADIFDQIDPQNKNRASAKNIKRLERRLRELEDEREDFFMRASRKDTPEMAALRRKLGELDVQQRDMAPEYSRVMKEARAKTDAEGLTMNGRPVEQYEIKRGWEADPEGNAESVLAAARETFGPKRDRFADASAADEAAVRVREAEARGSDPIAEIDDEIAVGTETLADIYERTGLTEDEIMLVSDESMTPAQARAVVDDVVENNKAVEAFSMCMMRRG